MGGVYSVPGVAGDATAHPLQLILETSFGAPICKAAGGMAGELDANHCARQCTWNVLDVRGCFCVSHKKGVIQRVSIARRYQASKSGLC